MKQLTQTSIPITKTEIVRYYNAIQQLHDHLVPYAPGSNERQVVFMVAAMAIVERWVRLQEVPEELPPQLQRIAKSFIDHMTMTKEGGGDG